MSEKNIYDQYRRITENPQPSTMTESESADFVNEVKGLSAAFNKSNRNRGTTNWRATLSLDYLEQITIRFIEIILNEEKDVEVSRNSMHPFLVAT